MDYFRQLERVLQWAKRWEQRLLGWDYQETQLRTRWLQKQVLAPYEEKVFPVLPNPDLIHSILIFKPDEIGDAVHSLPPIMQMKKEFPNAKLYLICQAKTAAFYERTQLFDEISPADVKMHFLRFPTMSLHKCLRGFSVEEFDLSIFLRTYPAFFKHFLKVPSRVRVHARDPRLKSSSIYQPNVSLWSEERAHQALQMMEIISGVTGKKYSFADLRYPSFQWSEQDRAAPDLAFERGLPKKYIVVHPFAKYETRRYPTAYWKEVLHSLAENFKVPVLMVGGPEDGKFPFIDGVIQMQGKLSLTETGYLLSKASAFIGNESGPGHWAAALGVPTVMLMGGHSLACEWAPLGRSLVLRTDVPCSPCHQRFCPVYGLACLKELKPEKVVPEAVKFLRTYFPKETRPSPPSASRSKEIPLST